MKRGILWNRRKEIKQKKQAELLGISHKSIYYKLNNSLFLTYINI